MLVGDGSYLMLPGELVTAVAQRVPIVIVLVDNHGYASIGALSRSVGSSGFGTLYRFSENGSVPVDPASTEVLPLDLAANAESLGARVIRARDVAELREALAGARGADGPVVVYIEADRYAGRARLRDLVGRAGGRGLRGGHGARPRAKTTSATTRPSVSIYARR